MSNSIVVFQENDIVITDEHYKLISEMVSTQHPTKAELDLYFYDCARRGVHPLDKLIYFTKRKGKYTPVTSIDYMRIRAESSGVYAGSDDAVFTESGGKYPEAATVTVWKIVAGVRCPFTATARWAEYAPQPIDGNEAFMWRKMPHNQLSKCAESLALRKAFPGKLSRLYSVDEMEQAGSDPSVDNETGEIVDNRPTIYELAQSGAITLDDVERAEAAPANGNSGHPDAPEKHWTETQDWVTFWTYVHYNLDLTDDEAHEALEVASAKDFKGSKSEAFHLLEAYSTAKKEAAEVEEQSAIDQEEAEATEQEHQFEIDLAKEFPREESPAAAAVRGR